MDTSVEPGTVPDAVDRAAARFADAVAVVDGPVRIGYAALRERVRTVAGRLIADGIGPGDRVVVWAPNSHHWVTGALGVLYAGATLVPINTRFTAVEAAELIARSRASALLVVDRFLGVDRLAELRALPGPGCADGPLPSLPGIRTVLSLPVDPSDPGPADSPASASNLASDAEIDARAAAVGPDDVSDILFTSGTTGVSKGAMSAHRQALAAAAGWAECFAVTADDHYLAINPFFHSFGYKAGILVCLLTGATLVPLPVFDVVRVGALVAAERITVLPGPPTVYRSLLDHPGRDALDLSSLRLAVTGADVVPEVLVERMRADLGFDEVLTAYGMTEAVVATLCRPGDELAVVSRTSGRAAPGMRVRVVDPGGRDVPAGATGEVWLSGPNVMLGYLDDPAATARAIDPEGWLRTGDIGVLDDAGNLRITDRLKDMYISGGFNVYPAEVEQALSRLDGVAESAVVGVPDERLGQIGKAFVVTAPGALLTAEAVLGHCARQLANYKRPRLVEFRPALPRNASGKVLKRELAGPPSRG